VSNEDKRAQLQLRLQQTVEGLSVAAISYYVIGLITYVAKGVKDAGFLPKPLTPELVTAVAVPFVVLAMWVLMKRVHHHITGGRHVERADEVQERRLAAAGYTVHDDELVAVEHEIDAPQDVDGDLARPVTLGDLMQLRERIGTHLHEGIRR